MTDTLPNSFHSILGTFLEKIEALRYDRDKIDPDNYMVQYNTGLQSWNHLNNIMEKCCIHMIPYPGPSWDPCSNFTYPPPSTIGPLMTSRWDQGDPYNSWCLPLGTATLCPGQRPWVGCVALAVGQVVRYTQPVTASNYNYSQMPDVLTGPSASGEIERLLRDAHRATLLVRACSYTASTTVKGRQALNDDFGISSAKRDGSISSNSTSMQTKVREQLQNGWPVIFGGTTWTNAKIKLPSLENAHAWVCDGYRYEDLCYTSRTFLHMNWGWGWAVNANGWCLWNNWTPSGTQDEYKLFLSMVYDIHN